MKIAEWDVPDSLYNKYVAWYATNANTQDAMVTLKCNEEMMKIHKEICEKLGIRYIIDDWDPFYNSFKKQVQHDSKSPRMSVDEVVAQKHSEESLLTALRDEFNKIKEYAKARDEHLTAFNTLWIELYDEIPPDMMDSETNWQNVLLWGHDDASFDDFLKEARRQ